MSSDDDGDDVKLYNPLERNRKRQQFVTISSSESESDSATNSLYEESPLVRKRRRRSRGASPDSSVARVVHVDDDEDDVETLMTPSEREAARLKEVQIEREIAQRIEQDALLSQTRAIMNKTSSTQRQLSQETEAGLREVISLDSDDDDDDDVQLLPSPASAGATSLSMASGAAARASTGALHPQSQSSSTSTHHHHSDKGERIVLKIRSNGVRTDDVPIHMREPFDVLYKNFCDALGLPRAAVHMSLDGDALALTATPQSSDLESGDLIDARVDFSQQREADMKKFVRLRLTVEGKRPEIFKIDSALTIEKLRASFCKKHAIEYEDDVELSALGVKLRLSETIESYGLRDDDEIAVEIDNFVDPSAISVQLRFADGALESHHVVPSTKVETLVQTVARLRHTECEKVSLRLDGEAMAPSQTFKYYDLEGGELIEVRIAS